MRNLTKFFNPRSIAIVGASPNRKKLGNILVKNIISCGWKGKLYFVNPKYTTRKKEYYANLGKIRKPVDLALIAIPAPVVNAVLKEGALSKPKIENYVVISAGFKEAGKKGGKLEEELKKIANDFRLNILGPNCLGFINTLKNLNATFTDARVKKGKIAIVSQSGALEVALLDWAEECEAGFSKAISIGNKAVLGENEVLNYLNKDKSTGAIALYLEDIKDGAEFVRATSDINCKKPIAVIKAGKSKAGQKAIASHTGSLAQDESVIEAVFKKLGIIKAESVEQFQDLISYLEYNKIPQSDKIIVVTNAGGLGVLSADFIGESKKIDLLPFSENVKKYFKEILPPGASVENPIDILGDASPQRYQAVLEIISKKFSSHPLLVVLTPQNQTNPLKVAKILGSFRKNFGSISASFVGGTKIKEALKELEKKKVPNFESPERALLTLQEAMEQKTCQRNMSAAVEKKKIHLKIKKNFVPEKAKAEKRDLLSWKETEVFFRKYKINLTKSQSVKSFKEINLKKTKFPCVLKTDDPEIVHRWEKKAVFINLRNINKLKSAWSRIAKKTSAKNFLLQPMIDPGFEIIIGMKRDQNFGPVVIVGGGGTFAEIFKDRAILVPPFSEKDVKESLSGLKIFPILNGFRGENEYNIDEIATLAVALQNIAIENSDISQIDINPVILYNNGSKYQIVDAKVYLKY
ncbi:MAG: hypothetical protein A2359_00740 [Candidatus Moranbacteria bacterium RIFOXYB1_FULL_43_19]|nr:MAG: hypothetical protein A2359_00740 [Candidatus Moranbacteria bacterium RIFOXYB1_FULL_43_19]OGI33823.1 MAG: hypothetical protein A2420_05380 [Candidatus Moranbacteria bacterium RIFOXYC1_FULL_44_13]OGI38771.1 MAG: hypothetical protein A2612_01040 [Candidatus Moranbacteria bacterium RIFOXYD1_FULL_44_12]